MKVHSLATLGYVNQLVERHCSCPRASDDSARHRELTGQVAKGSRRLLSDAHVQRLGRHGGARRLPHRQDPRRRPARLGGHGRQPARAEPLEGDEHEQEARQAATGRGELNDLLEVYLSKDSPRHTF